MTPEPMMNFLLLTDLVLLIFHIIINKLRLLIELFNFWLAQSLPDHPDVALRSKCVVKNTLDIIEILRKVCGIGRERAVSLYFFFHLLARIPGAIIPALRYEIVPENSRRYVSVPPAF